jgi:hypothetical protein
VKEQAAADAAAARSEAEDKARTHKKRMLALMQRCQELEQNHSTASSINASSANITAAAAAAYTAAGPIGRRASAAVLNLCKPASQLPDPTARNAAAPAWMSHNFE